MIFLLKSQSMMVILFFILKIIASLGKLNGLRKKNENIILKSFTFNL